MNKNRLTSRTRFHLTPGLQNIECYCARGSFWFSTTTTTDGFIRNRFSFVRLRSFVDRLDVDAAIAAAADAVAAGANAVAGTGAVFDDVGAAAGGGEGGGGPAGDVADAGAAVAAGGGEGGGGPADVAAALGACEDGETDEVEKAEFQKVLAMMEEGESEEEEEDEEEEEEEEVPVPETADEDHKSLGPTRLRNNLHFDLFSSTSTSYNLPMIISVVLRSLWLWCELRVYTSTIFSIHIINIFQGSFL